MYKHLVVFRVLHLHTSIDFIDGPISAVVSYCPGFHPIPMFGLAAIIIDLSCRTTGDSFTMLIHSGCVGEQTGHGFAKHLKKDNQEMELSFIFCSYPDFSPGVRKL